MQKLFIALFLLVAPLVKAQKFTALKLNAVVGYATPLDMSAGKGGFVYSVEPRYHLTHQLAVCLRFEQAYIQRSEILNSNLEYPSQAKLNTSGAIIANYAIGTKTVQPFIGIGAGLFHVDPSTQLLNGPSSSIYRFTLPAANLIGGIVRIGVNYSALTAEIAGNIMSDTSINYVGMNSELIGKNTYLTAKVGYTFGGRQR
ncbi:hypothetical protein IC229_25180 [Spirosoma sp. BT702]|uniref:Outer membrane protein beta-barrel domain-containing protein n=1 Tax=Spirosoma profusum TaxID=2771354 RepID=A0A927ASJ7_9BACT|nr:hypothetical protein [Spirosoma profusum]MBD2703963.1 hypothetical protein [Spirosoma profusum]